MYLYLKSLIGETKMEAATLLRVWGLMNHDDGKSEGKWRIQRRGLYTSLQVLGFYEASPKRVPLGAIYMYIYIYIHVYMVVSLNRETGDPNIDPKNTIVLIIGIPKTVPLILGNPHI